MAGPTFGVPSMNYSVMGNWTEPVARPVIVAERSAEGMPEGVVGGNVRGWWHT